MSFKKYTDFLNFFSWNGARKRSISRPKLETRPFISAAGKLTDPLCKLYSFPETDEKVAGRIHTENPRKGKRYYLLSLILGKVEAEWFPDTKE